MAEQLKYGAVYRYWDSNPPKGTLLVGPPGTGKTHAIRCLANEIGCHLVEIKYEDIASKYVDEPIEFLKQYKDRISERTSQGEKVIVFIDEAEILVPSRDTVGIQQSDRKKTNFFLVWMDGSMKVDPNVHFILVTNNEEIMDKAILRSGRVENRIVFSDLTPESVVDVLRIHADLSERKACKELFEEGIDWSSLTPSLERMTGADAEGIIKIAKKRKAQAHKLMLQPRFEEFLDSLPTTVSEDAALEITLEAELDIAPPLISAQDMEEAIEEFLLEKNRKRPGSEVKVRGFAN